MKSIAGWVSIIFRMLVVGAASVGLASFVDLTKLSLILRGTSISFFCVSVALLAAGVAMNALRWDAVMTALERPIGIGNAMLGYFEAMFFNQILPTSVGGDAARTVRAVDCGVTLGFSTMGVLIDRALGLWSVALSIALACLVASPSLTSTSAHKVIVVLAGLVISGGCVVAVIGSWLDANRMPSWTRPLVALMQAYSRVVRSPGTHLRIGVAMVLSTIFTVLSFAMCALALGVSIQAADAMLIVQGMVLASLVPVSIGGWGVREGAAIVLFSGIGIGATQAAAISILFGLALTALGILGAVVWLTSGYQRVGKFVDREPHGKPAHNASITVQGYQQ